QTSAKLAERGPSLRAHDAVAPTYPANPGSVTSSADGEASSATEFLREIEHQLLLIDQAIELITHVYSWILIFLSINYLTDLFFAIYLLMTMKADDYITTYVVYVTEALCFLFLTHNPADALSDAEEEFMVNLRTFIYRLPHDQRLQPNTGIVLALQRPRKLSLCNFGAIGRSSFLNTLAFMFSYVVTCIQFNVPPPPALPTTPPVNATN
ncbi:Gustatory receptor 135, partial [Hyalella azteca]